MHFIKNDLILIPFCFRIDDDDENGMTNKKKDPIVEKNKERVRKKDDVTTGLFAISIIDVALQKTEDN